PPSFRSFDEFRIVIWMTIPGEEKIMARQIAMKMLEDQIRQQVGNEILSYLVDCANDCVRLAENRHMLSCDPRVQLDRATNAAAYSGWRSAAVRVAKVCNVELCFED
ncbi:MAG: hypothetical protein U9R72_07425, partial [Chloroflexota bacterium]|nr:hypothetical protein [Chloroflexota bacterium]